MAILLYNTGLLEEKSSEHSASMNIFLLKAIKVTLLLKFWVGSVKTMTIKCAGGGCQITENKIESHQGEHTIYLSHSEPEFCFYRPGRRGRRISS